MVECALWHKEVIKMNKYRAFYNKINNFFDNELSSAKQKILLETITNENFKKEVNKSLKIFGQNNVSQISEQFELLAAKIDNLNLKFQQEQDKTQKLCLLMQSKAYFCLLEASVENSNLTKRVQNLLKEEFGESYLQKLSEIDTEFLSEDVKNFKKQKVIKDSKEYSNTIKLYLLLKKWQDITHRMYLDTQEAVFSPFIEKLCIGQDLKNNFMKELFVTNHYIEWLLGRKIFSLREIEPFVVFGFGTQVKAILGGKTYGLVYLYAMGADVPNACVIPVDYNLTSADLAFLDTQKHYSVRSSANIEDGENHSFAGMFDTYLDVPFDKLFDKVKKVQQSCSNARVKQYIDNFNLYKPKMAVIIQEFVEPEISGVWLGTAPNSGVLEYVNGNGEKLVSGKVAPMREVWAKNTVGKLKIGTLLVGELLKKYQKAIFRDKKVLPDFEWCIIDGKLKMLQFRNATVQLSSNTDTIQVVDEYCFSGVPCSSGVYKNMAQFIRAPVFADEFKQGNILLSMFTDPEWILLMNKAGALVTAMGGFLCHAGIIARELGIPCVTGIGKDALFKLKDKLISVDGTKGIITIEAEQ